VAILIALGVALGWVLTGDWRETEPASVASAPIAQSPASQPAASVDSPKAADADAPSARTVFKLPEMPAPLAEPVIAKSADLKSADKPARKEPADTVRVPRFWLLRGTAAQNYDLLSDRSQVKSGEASILIKSHTKNIMPWLNGSAMQEVRAESLLGKRLEVSAFLRAEDLRESSVALWFTAVDPNNLLLATENSRKQFPKIKDEWTRVSFVVDVPWAAAQVSYGVALSGRGSVWVDDLRLTTVDRTTIGLTTTAPPLQLGQRVESANTQGPLERPENLDFEETTEVPAPPRERSPEGLTSIRQ
jgi:hypothetical protein